jgi:hypothetical protein
LLVTFRKWRGRIPKLLVGTGTFNMADWKGVKSIWLMTWSDGNDRMPEPQATNGVKISSSSPEIIIIELAKKFQ